MPGQQSRPADSASQVVRSAVKRMHVAAVTDRRVVHFRPCLARDPDSPHANDSVRAAPRGTVDARLLLSSRARARYACTSVSRTACGATQQGCTSARRHDRVQSFLR